LSKPGTRTNRELHDRAAAMLRAMNADRPARRLNPHRNTGPAAAKTKAEAMMRGLQKEIENAKGMRNRTLRLTDGTFRK